MSRRSPAFALLLTLLPVPALCDVFEVPLPDLRLEFSGFHVVSRSTAVHLPIPPLTVQRVAIHISGVVQPGIAACLAGPPERPWPAQLSASTWDSLGHAAWLAGTLVPNQGVIGQWSPFDITCDFRPSSGATWETVMGGNFDVELRVAPAILIAICSGIAAPQGAVDTVTLLIDGTFPSPVLPSTWGQVKISSSE